MSSNESVAVKRGKILYIFEAALEYFISILVSGSFLATLTKQLGMSDSLTGILSSIISLGCLFQLLSVFFRGKRVKKMVIIMSIINQILFLLLYIIPLSNGTSNFKISLAVAVIFFAYAIYYFAHPKKINWLMSLVEDYKRGNFTANKEIVSLITGIAFTFFMGALVDRYAEKGELKTAFLITAIVMSAITVLHTATMIFIPEKSIEQTENKGFMAGIAGIIKNKYILSVTILFALYYIATYISTPFYGTYLISELNFSLKFVSILIMISSIARILASKILGAYADKNSFAAMLFICLGIFAVALLSATLATPNNGKIMFTIYYIAYGVSQGGINSALINLIFDYVPANQRADSLAISQATAGVVGFIATIAASPLIAMIQKAGNRILGITVYAQQLLSFLGMIFIFLAMIYIKKTLIKKRGS